MFILMFIVAGIFVKNLEFVCLFGLLRFPLKILFITASFSEKNTTNVGAGGIGAS